MDCSMPGFPVLHYLLEFSQTHSIESMMPSNHLTLCCPLLLLLSIFPSIRIFSSESALHQEAKFYPFDPSLLQSLYIYYFPDLNHSSFLDNSDSFTFLFKYHFTGKLPLAFTTKSIPLSPSNLHVSLTAILKLLSYIYLFCYIVSLTSFSHGFIKAWSCLIFFSLLYPNK